MTQSPNILFCIADDQSWPHASAYGCPWVNTPAFDRVAREGILFNNAFTPNAKCAPSRARHPHRSLFLATSRSLQSPLLFSHRTTPPIPNFSKTPDTPRDSPAKAGHRANRELIQMAHRANSLAPNTATSNSIPPQKASPI